MSKTVTYRGPHQGAASHPQEYVVPTDKGDLIFAQGRPVDVSDAVAKQLENATGYRFDVEPSKSDSKE